MKPSTTATSVPRCELVDALKRLQAGIRQCLHPNSDAPLAPSADVILRGELQLT